MENDINYQSCDQLSKLKKLDLQELLLCITNTNMQYRDKINIDEKQTFGIEIEFEKAKYNNIMHKINNMFPLSLEEKNRTEYKTWFLKTDATVRKNHFIGSNDGGEVVSPILTDTIDNWNDLKNVCLMLKKNKAISGENAGGHIHIGSQVMEGKVQSLINLIKLWIVYEKIIFRFSYGDKLYPRKDIDKYAPPISDKLFDKLKENHYFESISYDSLIFFIKVNSERKSAINFMNMNGYRVGGKNDTIEIRCPNGSIESIIWQNNINFFMKFLMYSNNKDYNSDIIDKKIKEFQTDDVNLKLYDEIYLEDALELCDMIFDNNLDKIYFLKQYLKSFKCNVGKQKTKQIVLY